MTPVQGTVRPSQAGRAGCRACGAEEGTLHHLGCDADLEQIGEDETPCPECGHALEVHGRRVGCTVGWRGLRQGCLCVMDPNGDPIGDGASPEPMTEREKESLLSELRSLTSRLDDPVEVVDEGFDARAFRRELEELTAAEQSLVGMMKVLPEDGLEVVADAVRRAVARGVDAEEVASAVLGAIPEEYRE